MLHYKTKMSVMDESTSKEIVLVKHESERKIMTEGILDRQSKIKINDSKLSQLSP